MRSLALGLESSDSGPRGSGYPLGEGGAARSFELQPAWEIFFKGEKGCLGRENVSLLCSPPALLDLPRQCSAGWFKKNAGRLTTTASNLSEPAGGCGDAAASRAGMLTISRGRRKELFRDGAWNGTETPSRVSPRNCHQHICSQSGPHPVPLWEPWV